jgi:hypothetical protein
MRLQSLNPGLIAISYAFNDSPNEELALKLAPQIARGLALDNDVLCYRPWPRDFMKSKGKMRYAFAGHQLRDEYIENTDGRVVQLSSRFCDFSRNFNPLLIPCNTPYFSLTIDALNRTLLEEGFAIEQSPWDDYKSWETARIAQLRGIVPK